MSELKPTACHCKIAKTKELEEQRNNKTMKLESIEQGAGMKIHKTNEKQDSAGQAGGNAVDSQSILQYTANAIKSNMDVRDDYKRMEREHTMMETDMDKIGFELAEIELQTAINDNQLNSVSKLIALRSRILMLRQQGAEARKIVK